MHFHTIVQVLPQLIAINDQAGSFGNMDEKEEGECAPEQLDKKYVRSYSVNTQFREMILF